MSVIYSKAHKYVEYRQKINFWNKPAVNKYDNETRDENAKVPYIFIIISLKQQSN